MIYTCTMNPAIDLFVEMDTFVADEVNRSKYEEYQPNGKGVNVSLILKQLNIESTALGFLGGFSGDFIKNELDKIGVNNAFVEVDGITRINTFVQSENGEFKIVNQGPVIDRDAQDTLIRTFQTLTDEDVLFVSGSLPRGVDHSILIQIAQLSKAQGFKLIWDISDPVLKDLVKYRPYLIKPNIDEFREIFLEGRKTGEDEMVEAAESLIDEGVENIIISNGGSGAWLINEKTVIEADAPEGTVVNTACSGDTLLATYYAVFKRTGDERAALKEAVAAGSSTAFRSGLTDFSDVKALMSEINVIDHKRTEV